MLRRVHATRSSDGHTVRITETPLWAAGVAWLYETAVMGLLGHPCCGHGPCARLPKPVAERLSSLAYLGLDAALRVEWKRERTILELPITADEARLLWTAPFDDEDLEDDLEEDELGGSDDVDFGVRCRRCGLDFAAGEEPTACAVNLLWLHLDRGEC